MKEFWTEENGRLSWTRLAGTILLVLGVFMSVMVTVKVYYSQPIVLNGTVIPPDIAYIAPMTFLILGILTLAVGAKVTQKWAEKSGEIEHK